MGFWFSAFLYGGFLIPGEDIYWPLKIFFYILPIKYTVRSMNYVDNIDAKFDGCRGNECAAVRLWYQHRKRCAVAKATARAMEKAEATVRILRHANV